MISDDRLQQAMTYLAETDEPMAELRTNVERMAYRMKQVESAIYLRSEGTVENRKAYARTSEEVSQATNDWLDALHDRDAMQHKRKTQELVIDVWRSLNANRRQAN